ncbi:MAG TPA: DUF421 domain-containing protein [Drouetiella sp.]
MWHITVPGILEIICRTSIIYLTLLIGIRVTGKREVGQLTPFDFVLLLVVSNAVQNAMIGPDTSLSGGLVAMSTLLILNLIVAKTGTQFPSFRRFVDGMPTVLISHGQIQWGNLHRENLSEEELMAALREHEVDKIADVSLAIMEVDGGISVIRKSDEDENGNATFVHSHRKRRHHIRKAN